MARKDLPFVGNSSIFSPHPLRSTTTTRTLDYVSFQTLVLPLKITFLYSINHLKKSWTFKAEGILNKQQATPQTVTSMVGFTFNANYASSTFIWLLLSFSVLIHSSRAFKIQKEDVSRPSKRLMSFQNGPRNSNWFTSSPSWFKEDPKFTLTDVNVQPNDKERSFLKDVLSIKNFFKDPRNSNFQMVDRNSHLKSTSTSKSSSRSSSESGGTLKKRDPSFSYIITKPSTSQLNSFSTSTYSLVESISGPEFFSHFDFFTGPDPTHGMVSYQTEAEATSKNLAFIDANGDAVLRVDNTSFLQQGVNRDSVRVESKVSLPLDYQRVNEREENVRR